LTPSERVQLAATGVVASGILGDVPALITHGQATLELAAATGVRTDWVDVVRTLLVRAYAWEERYDLAEPLVPKTDLDGSGPLRSIELRTAVAQLRWQQGRLREALDLASGAAAAAEEGGVTAANVGLAPRAILGSVLLELGRVREAEIELRAAGTSESVIRARVVLLARCGLARIWRAEGKFDAALLALDDARRTVARPIPGAVFASHVDLARADILIDLGEHAEAERLIESARGGPAQLLAAARLDTARGRFDQASVALEKLGTDEGSARQRVSVAIGQLAVACASGDDTDGPASLVLDLAEPEGFVFLIPEAGAAVLDAVCHVGRRRARTPYLDQLLVTRPHAVPVGNATIEYAIDALSERERVVLRYLVTAMSYREIADELYVSVNTIKTHVKNIIRKLQADSRADAITRARALHYL
ncbi:MAG TPA: LuxR C-terminal-related transcriptional regulator, partial [Acidimicrobiales bacterium]